MISTITDSQQGIFVLADISGYTQFSRLHFTSILHAEEIISELIESILDTVQLPLKVSQLEGDAILFVVETQPHQVKSAAQIVIQQVESFFAAFNERERSLIACDAGCACQACNEIGELRLKAVLHYGSFSERNINGITELIGSDISILRTLIKIPTQTREHILLSQPFYELLHEIPANINQISLDTVPFSLHIYAPSSNLRAIKSPNGAGPALSKRLNQHAFSRMLLNKPRQTFNNLPESHLNLFVYLLEGLNSAINILKKTFYRLIKQSQSPLTIKPTLLMLAAIHTNSKDAEALSQSLLDLTLSTAHPPLILNKLEGNAAFFYVIAENDYPYLADNLIAQAQRMQYFFKDSKTSSKMSKSEVDNIHLRILFHAGEVAFKNINQFDELAGLPVILIHRLLQENLINQSDIWVTNEFFNLLKQTKSIQWHSNLINLKELNQQMIWVSTIKE